MDWSRDAVGLLAGFLVAVLTTPVGVSGAVFLLPVQLSVLQVPQPRITPTNLLFNVVAGPGALLRYRRRAPLDRTLARHLILGSVPGVVLGSVARAFVAADPDVFRVIAAAVLAPLGWSLVRRHDPAPRAPRTPLTPRRVRWLAFAVGVAGGLYGIGGGSVLGPLLVGSGLAVATVAPVALLATWVTSLVGVATFVLLSLVAEGPVAPDWSLGICLGLGGLVGGWVGASLQPRVPEQALRRMLGGLALLLAAVYLAQALA
ncbi:sulfite exporter TauE/SafE family protein [Nocardioides sp.]|uniref:sulfite exporter TauE/SafE family protein n=1 Tax=Nocardioides sp. TaxID=35761 RepID=UPI00351612F1